MPGKLFRTHNEIYDVLNQLRDKKENYFDYTCSNTENNIKYLNLDCIEAKILKYILEIELKNKINKQKLILNLISNSDGDKLININYLKQYIKTVNDCLNKLQETQNNTNKVGGGDR
jgi:hypothetical protein